MARPKRQFSAEEEKAIEQCARNNSHDRTISTALDIPINTLRRRFGTKIRRWRAQGKIELRDKLYKQASNSPQTAIFIAKNELGMTDKQVIEQRTELTTANPAQAVADAEAAKTWKLHMANGA